MLTLRKFIFEYLVSAIAIVLFFVVSDKFETSPTINYLIPVAFLFPVITTIRFIREIRSNKEKTAKEKRAALANQKSPQN